MMNLETQAARDAVTAFLDALHPRTDTILTLKRGDSLIPLTAPDLRLVLAALDRHETIADADRQAAQHVRAQFEAGRQPTGGCENCACCVASGRHPVTGSTCPTDRLGDSACPCTGD